MTVSPVEFEFDGVVRLTRIAAGYLAFTLVVGFAAINTGNNSLYIALAFMLGGLIISGVASQGGLRHIEVEYLGVDEAWAGTPATGVIRARNDSKIWNVRDVVLISDDLQSPVVFPLLERGSSRFAETRFVFGKRGRARFAPVRLYTRYPFGLFLKKRSVRVGGERIVYPRLLTYSPLIETVEVMRGEKARTDRMGPGSEIRAFRAYEVGDSLRQIHWKRSASIGRLITKQTELEANQSVEIAIDPVCPPEASEQEFEAMISEAATLVRDAIDARLEVSLHTPAGTLRGGGDGARRPLFEALALVEPSGEGWGEWTDPHTIVFSLRRTHAARTA